MWTVRDGGLRQKPDAVCGETRLQPKHSGRETHQSTFRGMTDHKTEVVYMRRGSVTIKINN